MILEVPFYQQLHVEDMLHLSFGTPNQVAHEFTDYTHVRVWRGATSDTLESLDADGVSWLIRLTRLLLP